MAYLILLWQRFQRWRRFNQVDSLTPMSAAWLADQKRR